MLHISKPMRSTGVLVIVLEDNFLLKGHCSRCVTTAVSQGVARKVCRLP